MEKQSRQSKKEIVITIVFQLNKIKYSEIENIDDQDYIYSLSFVIINHILYLSIYIFVLFQLIYKF
jgi:hypothetical protein